MVADPLASSEAFIKALKSSADPPVPGGLAKIELATEAVSRSSLYIPAKGEIIAEWVLSKLSKERKSDRASNPCLDERYWRLLARVSVADPQSSRTKPTLSWLSPLLARYSLLSLVSAVMRNAPFVSGSVLQECQNAVRSIMPSMATKSSYDSAWELFSDTISTIAQTGQNHGTQTQGWLGIAPAESFLVLVLDACYAVLLEGSNKKKTLSAFTNGPLCVWINAQAILDRSSESQESANCLHKAASTILFGSEVIRQQCTAWTAPEDQSPSTLSRIFSESTDVNATLDVLPSIFQSFITSVQSNRSVVFAQQTGTERLTTKVRAKRACTSFLQHCLELVNRLGPDHDGPAWSCKRRMLDILETDHLAQADDQAAQAMLLAQGTLAVSLLNSSDPSLIDSLLGVLTILLRLDYTLLEPSLDALLASLTKIPSRPLAKDLLSLHTTYHIKTRTLSSTLSRICVVIGSIEASHNSNTHATFSKSCIGDRGYADELAHAIARYLTPSQVPKTTKTIVDALVSAWSSFTSTGGAEAEGRIRSSEVEAARFSALARIAGTVLLALPLHTATADAVASVDEYMCALYRNVIAPALNLALGPTSSAVDVASDTYAQVVYAAALRLAYSLQGLPCWRFDSESSDVTHIAGERLVQLLKHPKVLPELKVELVRTGLQAYSEDDITTPLITPSPEFFEALSSSMQVPGGSSSAAVWDGSFASLDSTGAGRLAGFVAIWEVVLDRWLVVVDAFAPASVLSDIVGTLLGTDVSIASSASSVFTLADVFRRASSSAQFWEVPNIEKTLHRTIKDLGGVLDDHKLSELLKREKTPITEEVLDLAVQELQAALRLPTEYLIAHGGLLGERALSADFHLTRPRNLTIGDAKSLVLLRTLVLRISQETGKTEFLTRDPLSAEYLSTQLRFEDQVSRSYSDTLDRVTLKIVEIVQSSAALAAARGSLDSLHNLLARNVPRPNGELSALTLQSRCTAQLLRILALNVDINKISDSDMELCRDIYLAESTLSSRALGALSFTLPDSITGALQVLEVHGQLTKVARWLKIEVTRSSSGEIASLLRSLVSQSPSIKHLDSFPMLCASILGLLVQSLPSVKDERTIEQVELVVAGCVMIGKLLAPSAWTALDLIVAGLSKSLSTAEHSHALSLLHSSAIQVFEDSVLVLHLLSVMIRNSPEGSFKINQEYTTRTLRCLSTLHHTTIITLLSALRITLDLTGEKSATLRNADIACIYTILGHAVSGSGSHGEATSSAIYESSVSILMALVRLRRDLVANALPHLAGIINRLCEMLRAVRPELAARQRRAVTDTLPFWINPSQPLGAESAKALARLLTNLTTKSVVRSASASHNDASNHAQSLAQPFSKHAPYVVTAYIRALTDPLSIMPPKTRQELEPGLFALCDMMGEYGRDAIMTAMLDDPGKAMMKILWAEYDKQRYVGKG